MTDQKATEILKAYKKIKLEENEEREIGRKCFAYANNWVDGHYGQWSNVLRQQMGSRPMLSINMIKKFLNRISGALRAAKVDEKVLPRDDQSDPLIADILTDLTKFVYDRNRCNETVFPRAGRDMIIWRGYVKVEWSDEFDPLGDICVTSLNPKRIFVQGGGDRYDLLDRKRIIEVLPMDKEDVIAKWPAMEEKIDSLIGNKEHSEPIQGSEDYGVSGEDYYDEFEDKCLVLRTQEYERVEVKFVKLPDGTLEEVKSEDVPKELPTVSKKMRRVHIYYSLGNVPLEDYLSKAKHNRFDIVRFAAYNDDGKVTSPVQDLLDMQDEKNKRRSQVIHILNSSPRNNYFVSKGAFDDPTAAEKQMGGINQLIVVNKPVNEVIKPIEGNLTAVPAIINMEQESTMDMKESSGLGDASLGNVPQGVTSGRGISALQAPTETIISEIFENYLTSRLLVAELILSLIQQYYTSYKRVRVLGDYTGKFLSSGDQQLRDQIKQQVSLAMPGASEEQVDIKTNEVLAFQPGTKLLAINIQVGEKKLNDISVGKYDVVFEHVSQSPTTRRAMYYDLLNLVSMGIPVPPKRLIEASDMRNKQEIINEIDQAQQAQAQAAAIEQAMGMGQQQQGSQKKATPAAQHDQMFNGAGTQMPQNV
jgi:hypothetical protein